MHLKRLLKTALRKREFQPDKTLFGPILVAKGTPIRLFCRTPFSAFSFL